MGWDWMGWMDGWMDGWIRKFCLSDRPNSLIYLNRSPHSVCSDVITLITSRFLLSSVFFLLLRLRMWVGRKERQLGQTAPSPSPSLPPSLLWRCSFDFRNCPLFTLRPVLLSAAAVRQWQPTNSRVSHVLWQRNKVTVINTSLNERSAVAALTLAPKTLHPRQ
jgi:hypothetical protein